MGTVVTEIVSIALTAAPWLVVGLAVAGLVKAFLPEERLKALIGGSRLRGVARAAIIGAPLPLCSCGAIPTAVTLHRAGAGRGPTTAFLIGTPGVGADSIAISYALLGPFMMLARIVGAVATAITTGWFVAGARASAPVDTGGETCDHADDGCCGAAATCRQAADQDDAPASRSPWRKLAGGMEYAFGDLYDDIGPWMLVGLVLAGVLTALVPPQTLADVGTGPLAIVVMAVIGIPLYICATAATPVAAGLLAAGVSPGAVITFLVAGPVTSLATLGVLRREMGDRALVRYLIGILVGAVALGFGVNALTAGLGIDVLEQVRGGGALLPAWLKIAALVLLIAVAIRPLRRLARWQPETGGS